jgi:hypothetical protein
MQAMLPEINRYPDLCGTHLREALAERFATKVDNIALGSGSESTMANIIRAFLHDDDEVLTSQGTFIGLYVLVNAQGIKLNTVPLKNYHFDLDAIADAVNRQNQDHLSMQSQQSNRDHIYPCRIRELYPQGARACACHLGRSLLRICRHTTLSILTLCVIVSITS